MAKGTSTFSDLPIDILFEILGYISVKDVIRIRFVCRRLWQASYHRAIWATAYRRSDLLLPEGPSYDQDSSKLEELLVRAEKIKWNWTSPQPTVFTKRRFPRELPTYHFDASIIAGRFLQVAQKDGISWYDLDATQNWTPILSYPCSNINTIPGYLNYQTNANGEGSNVAWISFVREAPRTIVILKVDFTRLKITLQSKVSANNLISIKMGHDWLLPIREFASPEDPMDFYYIPTGSMTSLPMHERVHHISDLNSMNYSITSQFLFLMFSRKGETLIDAYKLPRVDSSSLKASRLPKNLTRSYLGVYPYSISKLEMFDASLTNSKTTEDTKVSFLALVYVGQSLTSWTSKIGLHLFDVILQPEGNLTFVTQSERILSVGIVATTLSLSCRSGECLAVTYSMPGPVILAHHIRRKDSECVMNVKSIELPDGLAQNREMLGFDGFTGRLCLINGWTNIEILDM